MRIVVTGASGFVGTHVARRLAADGHELVLIGGRRVPEAPAGAVTTAIALGALEQADRRLESALEGADAVVHIAGLAHTGPHGSAEAFNAANETAVTRLCQALQDRGPKRLVLISSISARDPTSAYGRSKRQGEIAAERFAGRPGSDVMILRPPMIYGPGGHGNLGRILRLVKLGAPLPFARVRNRRSLCAVSNMASATACAATTPGASGTYEVCDDDIVSLPEIVTAFADGLGRNPRLWPMPRSWLHGGARLVSRPLADGLFGDLVLSNEALKARLGWAPHVGTHEGLAETARVGSSA